MLYLFREVIDMNIPIEELKKSHGKTEWCKEKGGYRIVYFYPDNSYYIGGAAKTIEAFMIEFVEEEPMEDDSDIPDFISIDDLLNRYLLTHHDICAVALYKTDGTCISKKSRNNLKKK